ncbi:MULTISPECIES: mechanosensitive ion channel family protein [Mesonia]|uniref:Miniconductance mechanosensitive channel YbdG n=1 Tax=Mesonia oceanica TaxID=2687242 RepID=A0AC61Y9W7_9FLAO|nr:MULTISPECIES: mechanosensitive ion channel family protein [Mesonia]MAN27549.1 mechanosensitive ion channel protein MscS [Mesonia sp.]MAQ40630.1 mechanosensitive ion channel protein MscS [Mesonia sp.]VVV00985.1 Miniconductance mechanosensitive channel YbdG [Mesonia oceanica]|tara:strand:+ start:15831 stop:17111 length:1281 start_codon:yes stop_codon:yes gene_type:complete
MDVNSITHYFYKVFVELGWDKSTAKLINVIFNTTIILIATYIFNRILRNIFKRILGVIARKTISQFDDHLYHNKVFLNFCHLLSVFILKWVIPFIFRDYPDTKDEIDTFLDIVTVFLVIWFIRSILLTLKDFLNTLENFKDKPIESYLQVFLIFSWAIGFIIVFTILTGKSIVEFLTALGAVSAIILLIFKDTLLGFVASIQVTVNDTVRIGDWITMEKYGADGDVIEINLASVKVRNFDNTITTIPTYYLISDSFKNWRGMSVSGGRRIKRALLIQATSIHYVNDEELEKFKKYQLITDYIEKRQADINDYNKQHEINKEILMNGRNMTNFGIFRKYVDAYLNQHSAINKDMMTMTRQLEPTSQGIPLEIYAFSKDKVWKNYEHIIADIFDHLLAATPYFNLELYELPTGYDFRELNKINPTYKN